MVYENVTNEKELFNLHYVNLNYSLPVSLHFQIRPLNTTVAYLFIYKFDNLPLLNSSIQQIDGWTLFCPQSKRIQ